MTAPMPGRAPSPDRLAFAQAGGSGNGNEVGAGNVRRGGLRILRLALGIVCGASACGNVQFVAAPFAPRHIDVFYSQQEDVTVIRWRMSAGAPDPAVTYELSDGKGGWQSIDFAASAFPGGVAPCGDGDGICAQMVLPGDYEPPADGSTPVRSRNPTYDVSPGDSTTHEIYVIPTLSINAGFTRSNQMVKVSIDDKIGGDTHYVFPRPLQRSIWDRHGVCVPGFFPPEAQFAPVDGLSKPWPAPSPLSDSGRYCASVHAQPTSGATGADYQIAIDTVPEVVDADQPPYMVPTEMTPFTYQIVLDLSIPVADRCREAMDKIESNVAKAFGPQLRMLPTIDLSAIDPQTGMPGPPCRQSPYRALDAAGVAQQIKLAAASWPEQHQRYYMLYFNNLRAQLPDSLTRSFDDFTQTIVTPPPPGDFQAFLWPWGPTEMTSSYSPWLEQSQPPPQVWTAADDPTFLMQLQGYAATQLPLISEIQDPMKPVPLLSSADAQQYDGGFIRLCTISITPLQDTGLEMVGHDADGKVTVLPTADQYAVKKDDPPAYLLELPKVWAVPDIGFSPHTAQIHYEICTRYCDHPFVAESGSPVMSGWMDNPYCLGPPSKGGQ
jgi:hypothetical protein